jgi:broad specificity phosphatase PhoE
LFNLRNIISGQHGDPPLTEHGRKQAAHARESIPHASIDAVYSSDFQRARETAEIITGRTIPADNQLAELRERNFGEIDGKHTSHLDKLHEEWQTLPDDERWHHRPAKDMETDHELATRWHAALEKIARENEGKQVLVAVHGSGIRTTLMKIGNLTYDDLPRGSIDNGAIVELDYDGKNFKVVRIVQPKL